MIAAIKKAGGNPRYTELPGAAHDIRKKCQYYTGSARLAFCAKQKLIIVRSSDSFEHELVIQIRSKQNGPEFPGHFVLIITDPNDANLAPDRSSLKWIPCQLLYDAPFLI